MNQYDFLREVTVFLEARPLPMNGEKFQMTLKETRYGTMKIVMMAHYDEHAYAGKRLPESVMKKAHDLYGLPILPPQRYSWL